MANLNKIKDNLTKIDYSVKLNKTSGLVVLTLPGQKNKLTNIEPKYITYEFKKNKIIKNLNGKSDIIKAPSYSLKMLAILDIILECNRLNYPPELINFNDETSKSIDNVDNEPISKIFMLLGDNKCSKKEQDLITIVSYGIENGFSPEIDSLSEQSKVNEGYQIVKQIFLQGFTHESE